MPDLEQAILAVICQKKYKPLKLKTLADHIGLPVEETREFRRVLSKMAQQGKVRFGRNTTVLPPNFTETLTGRFKRLNSGDGIVFLSDPKKKDAREVWIPAELGKDAATDDTVSLVIERGKRGGRNDNPSGRILEILERATSEFVGVYFTRDGEDLVRIDGNRFRRSVRIQPPIPPALKPNDRVVVRMLKFPQEFEPGEGIIQEVLGVAGDPAVDSKGVIRSMGIPDEFPADALEEAARVSASFNSDDFDGRENHIDLETITIDPIDAKDHDDAISWQPVEGTNHVLLGVHIADVTAFVPTNSALDREARKRATSVYLPGRVVPMFPELISNGVASLKQGVNRYVKSAWIELNPDGTIISTRFSNSVICVRHKLHYGQVQAWLAKIDREEPTEDLPESLKRLLLAVRKLARSTRLRRKNRGALQMNLPEAKLGYDEKGHVVGAFYAEHFESHELVEECMLTANEAVARHLDSLEVPFLRRVHPAPDPEKLANFAEFAANLGHPMESSKSRFELQRILIETEELPTRHAIHYALLRSLKQATYSPVQEEHFALASDDYCHFTSPIRRYPDVTVHRLLQQWLAKGKVAADQREMESLGDHCTKMERRAETAEREVVKLRLLNYLSSRIGLIYDAVITGVTEHGFYAQGAEIPAEGMVHISSMNDDYYDYDERNHTLQGRKSRQRYRLGDRLKVKVSLVDPVKRRLELLVESPPLPDPEKPGKAPKEKSKRKKKYQ
jgi:ribonuclease R